MMALSGDNEWLTRIECIIAAIASTSFRLTQLNTYSGRATTTTSYRATMTTDGTTILSMDPSVTSADGFTITVADEGIATTLEAWLQNLLEELFLF